MDAIRTLVRKLESNIDTLAVAVELAPLDDAIAKADSPGERERLGQDRALLLMKAAHGQTPGWAPTRADVLRKIDHAIASAPDDTERRRLGGIAARLILGVRKSSGPADEFLSPEYHRLAAELEAREAEAADAELRARNPDPEQYAAAKAAADAEKRIAAIKDRMDELQEQAIRAWRSQPLA